MIYEVGTVLVPKLFNNLTTTLFSLASQSNLASTDEKKVVEACSHVVLF